MNILQEAVSKLASHDICAEYRNEGTQSIWGGAEVSESAGIKIYKNSFNLSFENDEWILRLPGEGQMISELKIDSLDDATEKVIQFYSHE